MADKLWQICKNPVGRPRVFKSPQEMWNKALEYFQWVDENPWQQKSAQTGGTNTSDEKRINQNVRILQRAYTLYGLCAFWGTSRWADIKRTYEKEDDFKRVLDQIENIIISQQVDGALLDQFNGNLVARLNGIAEVTVEEVKITDCKFPTLSDEDIEKIKEINERGKVDSGS